MDSVAILHFRYLYFLLSHYIRSMQKFMKQLDHAYCQLYLCFFSLESNHSK